jgi:hypothetical protein
LIDFGFVIQKLNNQDRLNTLTSLDWSTAYLLVTDLYSDAVWTVCTSNNQPPIAWLNKLLTKFRNKGENCALVDLGGELGKHPEVTLLLEKHGYNIYPMSPDASYKNAPGERPHQNIANTRRTLLEGANLPEFYWNHTLYHYTDVHRYVTHCCRDKTPYELISGKHPDLSKL